MKKSVKVIIVAMVGVMLLGLTACGKFTCDICGKEKTGKRHERTILGTEIVVCNDCVN